MEYLETQGVPVLTLGGDEIPGFYSTSASAEAFEARAESKRSITSNHRAASGSRFLL